MRVLRRWFARIVNFATGRRGDQRLEEEQREHLILQTEENIRSGMEPAEARRQAVLKFGHLESIRETYHAVEGLPLLESLLQDVRYGARVLVKSRAFTVVAVTSLALAIGANTTIFSIAKQLLFERLAVPHVADLRLLTWTGTRSCRCSRRLPYFSTGRINQLCGIFLSCLRTASCAEPGARRSSDIPRHRNERDGREVPTG